MSLQLARIEAKVDAVIRALQFHGLMIVDLPSLHGLQRDACPLCSQLYSVRLNLEDESVEVLCGCELPIKAIKGISALLTPPENDNASRRTQADDVPPEPEERAPVDGGRLPVPGPSDRP